MLNTTPPANSAGALVRTVFAGVLSEGVRSAASSAFHTLPVRALFGRRPVALAASTQIESHFLIAMREQARLAEQRDRDYSLVLDLTGFILGFIPGLLVLFLVSVRP